MEKAILVDNLSVSYSGIEAINNITLSIDEGEFVCIVGPNGGGKTTLLNSILGILKPDNGIIKLFGTPYKSTKTALSYVPQTAAIDRGFPITVLETVMTAFLKRGFHPFKLFSKSEKAKAVELLKTVGLECHCNRQISELSGGEFQRLLIARALALEPKILLLDEPTASVDGDSRNKIFALLKALNKSGMTVVTVTHDYAAAEENATKLICINREVIYCGKPLDTKGITEIMYKPKTDINGGYNNA